MKILFAAIILFAGLLIPSLFIYIVFLHIQFTVAKAKSFTTTQELRYVTFIKSRLTRKSGLAVVVWIPLCLTISIMILSSIRVPYHNVILQGISKKADVLSIRTGGLCHRNPELERQVYNTNDPNEIRQLSKLFSFGPSPFGMYCKCCGELTFEFHKNSKILYAFSLHHGTHIRIQGQSTGDIYLTSESIKLLNAWLVEKGIRNKLDETQKNY